MFEQFQKEEILHIFNEIEHDPDVTQRIIAQKLDISLGKTNYILKKLITRGLIRAKHFASHPGKIRKINYILTKEGFESRVFLVKHFLQLKELEYNKLKEELEKLIAQRRIKDT
jgi:EPS-associated MarR family transcriptional regulator